ncbi:hypothetical protein EJ06DRAFT_89082 [Trichodelitschia bisporula]|uniref:DUF676 domain-containing protein n=1 Tax=Trichodelitschia bisporula TaxID=703511 RepID=A0A6G1HSJ0_9PEZI|nr:hypothetical protein EJ06DRAFT_89082 [Trichodelitschia bisporula]
MPPSEDRPESGPLVPGDVASNESPREPGFPSKYKRQAQRLFSFKSKRSSSHLSDSTTLHPTSTSQSSDAREGVTAVHLASTSQSSDAREEVTEEPFGLFILYEPDVIPGSEAQVDVDIVALHGLNGHCRNTFTDPSTGKLWLKDFLPRKLPNARIMTFGYDSRLAFSGSTADLDDFALSLLNRLSDHRRTKASIDRPLIFVGHSLGGIVVKKALITAHENDSQYGHILQSCKGIVFFGTPHRGADLASRAEKIGRVPNALAFGSALRTDLLRVLKAKSDPLQAISRQFVQRAKNMQIVSFYERRGIGTRSNLIVDRDSATIGIPNERMAPIMADHRAMCRFPNATSQSYLPIEQAIVDMVAVDTFAQPPTTECSASSQNPSASSTAEDTAHRQSPRSPITGSDPPPRPPHKPLSRKAEDTASIAKRQKVVSVRASDISSQVLELDDTVPSEYEPGTLSALPPPTSSSISTATSQQVTLTIKCLQLSECGQPASCGDVVLNLPADTSIRDLIKILEAKGYQAVKGRTASSCDFSVSSDLDDSVFMDTFAQRVCVTSRKLCGSSQKLRDYESDAFFFFFFFSHYSGEPNLTAPLDRKRWR